MVMNLSRQHLQEMNNLDKVQDVPILKKKELWHYDDLVHALENNLFLHKVKHMYVPIKLPSSTISQRTPIVFYELQLLGYIPVIVDAENNKQMKRNPHILLRLIANGALVQINASSVMGEQGKGIQRYAIKLCKKGLVHMVDPDTCRSEKKPSILKDAYKYIERKISASYVNYLEGNAEHVIKGTHFHVMHVVK